MGVVATIVPRLALCCAEIFGIKRWDNLPPVTPLTIQECPCGYGLLGPSLDPIPNTSAGQYIVRRRYVERLVLAPAATAEQQTSVGAKALADAMTFIDLFTDYFMSHPRLHTDGVNQTALNELVIVGDLLLTDTGPVDRPTPGGSMFICVDFYFDVAMRGSTARTAYLRGG